MSTIAQCTFGFWLMASRASSPQKATPPEQNAAETVIANSVSYGWLRAMENPVARKPSVT